MKQWSCVSSVRAWCLTACLAVLAGVGPVALGQGGHAERLAIMSQLQSMAQGTYSPSEWQAVVDRLDTMLAEARNRGDAAEVVETQIIRSRVLVMQRQDAQAMDLLRRTIDQYRDADVAPMKKVYVELASIQARRGDEKAVTATMNEFKASRHFDGGEYSFSGGSNPQDPVVLPRPKATGDSSISLTAMQVYRTKAQFAAGYPFPEFETTDWSGRNLRLADYRGQVVLVDFWSAGWFVWKRDLAYRLNMYQRLHAEGFEIIGLNIEPDHASAQAFAAANNMTWPQGTPPRALTKELGIFGETTNFLLDRQGNIVGRDLYGADLEAAVRVALKR